MVIFTITSSPLTTIKILFDAETAIKVALFEHLFSLLIAPGPERVSPLCALLVGWEMGRAIADVQGDAGRDFEFSFHICDRVSRFCRQLYVRNFWQVLRI